MSEGGREGGREGEREGGREGGEGGREGKEGGGRKDDGRRTYRSHPQLTKLDDLTGQVKVLVLQV